MSASCHTQQDLIRTHREFIYQSNWISIFLPVDFQNKHFWANTKGAAVIHEKLQKNTWFKRLSMYLIHSSSFAFITEYGCL